MKNHINDTTFHTFHTLLIHLRGGLPDALPAFARQQTAQGTAVHLMEPAETVAGFLSRHPLSPERLLLVSDSEKALAAARNHSIAAAGFQRTGTPYLPAPYLFQEFTEDLGDYLRLAYCRFHGLPFTTAYTPRLVLRETCQADLPLLLGIYKEADCTTACRFFPAQDPEAFLDSYIQTMYGLYQLGMYTVIRRSDNAVIGHCGFDLKASPLSASFEAVPYLGYILSVHDRRQGYALEACRACLNYLSLYTDYQEVFCAVSADNSASLKLARRLGFDSLVILTDDRPHAAGFQPQLPAGHAGQLILRNQL